MKLIIIILFLVSKLYSQNRISNRTVSDTLYVIYPKTDILIYHKSNPTKTNFDKTHYSIEKPKIIYYSIKGFEINFSEEIENENKTPILQVYPNNLFSDKQVLINKNTIMVECKSDNTFEIINKK